ncbi:MAG: ABC transporter permease [Candidatus Hydrogenedentes bacterium]|nr:ABC transporter permease [Candidatus Hydrogenedentota bacterium]
METSPRNSTLATLPRDLLQSRELLMDLVRKDLRVRYRYAVAGFLWAALEPLAYMAVLTFVFQWVMAPRTGTAMFGEDVPYAMGLLCGLVFWQFSAHALTAATNSLIDNQHLVKKVNFTREIVPLAAFGYPCVALLIGFVILIAVHLALGGHLGLGLLWLPVLFGLQFAITLGLALIAAAGNVRYRDVGYLVSVVLVLGFYASPVFYDLDWVLAAAGAGSIPGSVTTLYLTNPMTELLEAYRQIILEGRSPDLWLLAWPFIFAAVTLPTGAIVFRRSASRFSDYL